MKLVAEYQTAATRFDEPGTCKARGSEEVVGPGVGRLSAGGDRVAGREAGRAGDDVVALAP